MNAKVEDLKRKYDDIMRQVNGEDTKLKARDLLEDSNLPFTDRVKNFPMPNKFKMPHMDKYDGNGDPIEHIKNF